MESPDIVGVIEMLDNNGQNQCSSEADASESYMRMIDEIERAGGPTYDYVNINPEYNQDGGAPHGNIRVGFLYNPNRVSLSESSDGHGGPTDAVAYEDGQLTLNPGRIDPKNRSEEHTSELQSRFDLVCRLLLE